MVKCPGQDQRFWKPDDIFEADCPECGTKVEFWKDEPRIKCPKCKKGIWNPKIDLGCAEWCQYAEQCLGVTTGKKDVTILCDKLIAEMKGVFGEDEKRINHALMVLKYAEEIRTAEGGDPLVVKAAAILHDIGIHEAQKKHGSSAGKYQEEEGPGIAKDILLKHEVDAGEIEHVCRIIANHHSAKDIDTTEFRIIWDADLLVNMLENTGTEDKEQTTEIIDSKFKTNQGRKMAKEELIVKG
jgi:hypothetical protein